MIGLQARAVCIGMVHGQGTEAVSPGDNFFLEDSLVCTQHHELSKGLFDFQEPLAHQHSPVQNVLTLSCGMFGLVSHCLCLTHDGRVQVEHSRSAVLLLRTSEPFFSGRIWLSVLH